MFCPLLLLAYRARSSFRLAFGRCELWPSTLDGWWYRVCLGNGWTLQHMRLWCSLFWWLSCIIFFCTFWRPGLPRWCLLLSGHIIRSWWCELYLDFNIYLQSISCYAKLHEATSDNQGLKSCWKANLKFSIPALPKKRSLFYNDC